MIPLSIDTIAVARTADIAVFGRWREIGEQFNPFQNQSFVRVLFPFDGTLSNSTIEVLHGIAAFERSKLAFAKLLPCDEYSTLAIDPVEFEFLYRDGWGLPGFRICSPTQAWGGVFSPRDGFCVIGAPTSIVKDNIDECGGLKRLRQEFEEYIEAGGIGFGLDGRQFGRLFLLSLFS